MLVLELCLLLHHYPRPSPATPAVPDPSRIRLIDPARGSVPNPILRTRPLPRPLPCLINEEEPLDLPLHAEASTRPGAHCLSSVEEGLRQSSTNTRRRTQDLQQTRQKSINGQLDLSPLPQGQAFKIPRKHAKNIKDLHPLIGLLMNSTGAPDSGGVPSSRVGVVYWPEIGRGKAKRPAAIAAIRIWQGGRAVRIPAESGNATSPRRGR